MIKVFGEKREGVEYRTRKGVYGVILNHETDELLTVRDRLGNHFLPGGGLEEGETHYECIQREMLEETGYLLSVKNYIGHSQRTFFSSNNEPLLSDGYFYEGRLLHKVQEPLEANQCPVWVAIMDAKQLLFHEHHDWAVSKALGN
ncbi:NUDIX domain-containing protein [Rossellomorea aquimaris]|uniref:NUDIX domain-containing protein n=1 Tax=Rossellomorea aquimaris TaxID=189382 RepID=UPI001CD3B563|nr:NUDIX domain-containing protein [Rossellomorea aquimaris]MCA1054079.1 NUDIX domain-containing protein [Rossellomorea aquimaris]